MSPDHRLVSMHCKNWPIGADYFSIWRKKIYMRVFGGRWGNRAEPRPSSREMPPARLSSDSLLFVGTFNKKSGLDYLLYAFSAVRVLVPSATLIVRGTGDLPKGFVGLARRLDVLDAISVAPIRDGHELNAAIAASRALVMPALSSKHEGDEIECSAIVSALALGRPVVTTFEAAGSSFVVDGVDGYLHAARDTNSFARSMIKILRQAKLEQ